MRKLLLFGLSVGSICISTPSFAQQRVNEQDRRFVAEADAAGEQEIGSGRLAEAQAGNPAVREFGRWMATDHTMLGEMLARQARTTGVPVPKAPADPAKLDALRALHGQQFDQSYVAEQVEAHQKTLALFQREAANGQNPGLKSLARFALPTLQQHITEAKELQALSFAKMPAGEQMSLPSSAPPASTSQVTGSTAQSPTMKQMNEAETKRVEKEGK